MTDSSRCACCAGRLEPAQELRFLVETATLDNPAHLARIRRLPAMKGKPIPVCVACHKQLESAAVHPAAAKPTGKATQSGILAAVGILSVGWLLQNLILGPRS